MIHFGYNLPLNEWGFIQGLVYILFIYLIFSSTFTLSSQFRISRKLSRGMDYFQFACEELATNGFLAVYHFIFFNKIKSKYCPMTKQYDSDHNLILSISYSEPTNSHEKHEVYSFNPFAGIP